MEVDQIVVNNHGWDIKKKEGSLVFVFLLIGVFCGSLQWEIVVWLRFTSVFSKEYTQESLLTFCTNNSTIISIESQYELEKWLHGVLSSEWSLRVFLI